MLAIHIVFLGDFLRFQRMLSTAALLGSLALTGCSAEPPDAPPQVQAYYDEYRTATPPAPGADVPVKIDAALLAAGTKTVIFGDSWTRGTGADVLEHGYAYLTGQTLGWDNRVMGVGGTGYVNPGPDNAGTFGQRIAALPEDRFARLVIMQGSINDTTQDVAQVEPAALAAVDAMRAKFPSAQVVILGPAPNTTLPTGELVSVDRSLRKVATAKGLPYISPVGERWIGPGNFATVIDRKQASHPSTAGHQYLAGKTVAALKALV